ncbi:MAG: hypothetical protein LKF36_00590 [Lactobacillus sp.]|jgi:hypothetical protein|nr:hypothetical protein [Lactobacillus sp.]
MKFKMVIAGLAVALGALTLSTAPISAASTIEKSHGIYYSRNQAIPLYHDPELTKPSGKTLDPAIDSWQAFYENINEAGQVISVDLGGNQWVNTAIKAVYHNVAHNSAIYLEAFSGGKSIQLYSDPELKQPIGKLDPTISDWKITAVDYINESELIYSVDLGNNQWASIEAFPYMLPKAVMVDADNTLVNLAGQPTGKVTNTAINYLTFGVKYINDKVFINLGNDDQWIAADQVVPSLIP